MKILKILGVTAASLIAATGYSAESCKAYVKLDLGYGFASDTRAYGPVFRTSSSTLYPSSYSAGLDKDQTGVIGDVAIGYAFNDAMRGEISFDFKPKMIAHSYTFGIETQEYGGSAKVLYDFNNNTSVTPFVFGGLGAANIKPKIKPFTSALSSDEGRSYIAQINSDSTLKTDSSGNVITYSALNMPSKTVLTYQAGFGLALKASDSISVDLTYGLGGKTNYQVLNKVATLNVPQGQAITQDDGVNFKQLKFKNQLDQSLTIGIRYTM